MLKVERKWWSARGSASQLVRVNVQGGETRSLWSPFYRQTAMFHMPFCCCCYCWRWIVWPVARKIEQVVELVTWRVRQSGGVVVAACAPDSYGVTKSMSTSVGEEDGFRFGALLEFQVQPDLFHLCHYTLYDDCLCSKSKGTGFFPSIFLNFFLFPFLASGCFELANNNKRDGRKPWAIEVSYLVRTGLS